MCDRVRFVWHSLQVHQQTGWLCLCSEEVSQTSGWLTRRVSCSHQCWGHHSQGFISPQCVGPGVTVLGVDSSQCVGPRGHHSQGFTSPQCVGPRGHHSQGFTSPQCVGPGVTILGVDFLPPGVTIPRGSLPHSAWGPGVTIPRGSPPHSAWGC